jgi:hypothetical protein
MATLNADLGEEDLPETTIKLDSKGWVGLIQGFQSKSLNCEQIAKKLRVQVFRGHGKDQFFSFDRYCEDQSHRLIFRTSQPLSSGEYRLRVTSQLSKKVKLAVPKLFVEYVDPNFSAGIEQMPSGSKILEKNGVLQGIVNVSKGIKTAWYQVAGGEKGFTTLGYLVEGSEATLRVTVYQMSEELKPIKAVSILKPKRQQKFEFGKHPLYVEVEGPPYSGEVKYSLFRKDSDGATGEGQAAGVVAVTSYPLIERYVLSATSAVLVIKSNDKLKVGAELTVSGKRNSQKFDELGKCSVASIQGIEANCQLDQVNLTGVTQIKIESLQGE